MFDRGSGPPVIVIPGVQGRWEWMKPALEALSRTCRTISYSLRGDIGSGARLEPELGFDAYVQQLDELAERLELGQPAVCGVSYGGWIALRYAARHADRISSLVLVSAPSPGWSPSPRQAAYISRPWLSAPAFMAAGPLRVWPEIHAALPDWPSRLRFSVAQGLRVLSAPMIPPLMSTRVQQAQALDFRPDCERIAAPTLVVTGEEGLDSVVPVHVTRRYCSLIRGARYEMMPGTGHIGMVTQPERFSELVGGFVHANYH
jgi:pimeloyl-ACP methyl ester carboxylesterase